MPTWRNWPTIFTKRVHGQRQASMRSAPEKRHKVSTRYGLPLNNSHGRWMPPVNWGDHPRRRSTAPVDKRTKRWANLNMRVAITSRHWTLPVLLRMVSQSGRVSLISALCGQGVTIHKQAHFSSVHMNTHAKWVSRPCLHAV